ncbi:MAG: tetratricopeptide repeat protein [Lysobacterales bacterium]
MPARPPIPHTLISEPPVAAKPKIRPSNMGKWRALVLVLVHVLIGLHIAHWLSTGESLTPVEPSEAMAFSRSSIVNTGLLFFAATIVLTAIFGRFFCGWGCHVLALQDLCRHWMLKLGITPRPLKSRALMWVPALAFFYMFLWPALYRWWIGDSLAVRGWELTTTEFWATFPGLIVGALTFLVCGFACVYFLGAKGFCTYACPYGAIFSAADRVAPMRIRVTDACESCGHCTAVCSSNVRVHEEVRDWGMVVSPGCMKCQDCVSVCPKGALYYGAGPIPLFAKPRPGRVIKPKTPARWGDEILLVLSFALAFLILRGLYGAVPFLMALGSAAVVAFLALTAAQLIRQPTLERPGLRLKRGGTLLPMGRVFVGVLVLLVLFLAQSAYLQVHQELGDRAYAQTEILRRTVLATPDQPPAVSDTARAEIESAIPHLLTTQRWGLTSTLGNAARLAWLQALTGNTEAAEDSARVAIDRHELPGEMHQLLAHLALAKGDATAAISEWNLAIEAEPDRPEAYLAQGLFLARNGDVGTAQLVFDRGLAAQIPSPELSYNAGLARALSGKTEESITFFEHALALNPQYLEARENLAGMLASLGRYPQSAMHYRIALTQKPGDIGTRLLLARVLFESGQVEDAKAAIREALQIAPSNTEARAMLDALGEHDSGGSLPPSSERSN